MLIFSNCSSYNFHRFCFNCRSYIRIAEYFRLADDGSDGSAPTDEDHQAQESDDRAHGEADTDAKERDAVDSAATSGKDGEVK